MDLYIGIRVQFHGLVCKYLRYLVFVIVIRYDGTIAYRNVALLKN